MSYDIPTKQKVRDRIEEIISLVDEACDLSGKLSKDLVATKNQAVEDFEYDAGISRSAAELKAVLNRMVDAQNIWLPEWFDQIEGQLQTAPVDGWHPIYTAPVDGTPIRVRCTYNTPDGWETKEWTDSATGKEQWPVWKSRIDIPFPPTHWRPEKSS